MATTTPRRVNRLRRRLAALRTDITDYQSARDQKRARKLRTKIYSLGGAR